MCSLRACGFLPAVWMLLLAPGLTLTSSSDSVRPTPNHILPSVPLRTGGHPPPPWPPPSNCSVEHWGAVPADCANKSTDATAAFEQAWGAGCATVVVGSGTFRVDGTLRLFGRQHLHLTIGATLLRCASNWTGVGEYGPLHSAPVVLLDQLSVLDGRGMVYSLNPAPRGIVTIGPISTGFKGNGTKKDCSSISNADFATVEGISIYGNGKYHDMSLLEPWTPNSTYIQCGMFVGQKAAFGADGTVGLCVDSGQINCGGSTYQNTIRDVFIRYVDVSVYVGAIANSNMFYNLNFYNSQVSIWSEKSSENTFVGGFTGGGFSGTQKMLDDSAIIRATDTLYNYFSAVQGEPGGGRFLDITGGLWNTVLGHNNCVKGSTFDDTAYVYLNSGEITANELSAKTVNRQFPDTVAAPTDGQDMKLSDIAFSPTVIYDKGCSDAVHVGIPRLASTSGNAHFRITLSALTTSGGDNPTNPAQVDLASAELLVVPWCCVSGSPSSERLTIVD